jgi:hypothetical protein
MRRPHERAAKGRLRHDATNWIDLIHQLDARTRGPASGCPAVVMVQSTHHRKSDHLVACILRERNQSALCRDLLPNPLMGSCSVEVYDIRIQDPLELLFLKNQQMVKAFLPHTPGEALADRISSRRVRGRFEKLDPTGRCNTSKARPKFVIGITYQILWLLSIGRGGFSQLLGHPGIGRRACHSDLDHLP